MPIIRQFQYPTKVEPVAPRGETTEASFHQPWSEPVRQRIKPALAVALAASGMFFSPQQSGEQVNLDKWYAPYPDPVRIKQGLTAPLQQSLAMGNPQPGVSFSWFAPGNFTEPVRFKPGLSAPLQQVLAFQPQPVVSFSWFNELSKPATLVRAGLPAGEQPFFTLESLPRVSFGWFGNLSDPVRIKPGLRPELQQSYAIDTSAIPLTKLMEWFAAFSEPARLKIGFGPWLQQFLAAPSRLLPTPTLSGTLSALETKDVFLGGIQAWNRVISGEIGVIENKFTGAVIGVIEQRASVGTSGVVEARVAPTPGSAVTVITTAHVSIRII